MVEKVLTPIWTSLVSKYPPAKIWYFSVFPRRKFVFLLLTIVGSMGGKGCPLSRVRCLSLPPRVDGENRVRACVSHTALWIENFLAWFWGRKNSTKFLCRRYGVGP